MCPSESKNGDAKHSCSHEHDHEHSHDHSHSRRSSSHFGHSHHHHHGHGSLGNIGFAFALNLIFSLVELVGGLAIGSMAIVAGAIHDLGDAVSLGSAWILERLAKRGRDQNFHFGYKRFSLLSALIAGVVISTGSIMVVIEAAQRFVAPDSPPGKAVVAFACLGLAVNGLAAWRLSRGLTQNERMMTWHSLDDLFSWSIVLIGGIAIAVWDIAWLDPLLAMGLAIFVLYNVLRHLKETAYLFLQGRPENFDEEEFRRETLAIEGVEHIDHLSIWSLDGESSVLSARLHLHGLRDPLEIERVKVAVRAIAARHKAKATLETCMAESVDHGEESG